METTANTEFVKDDPKRPWIGLFCFLTASLGAYLLYKDYQTSEDATGDVLATIERKDQKVRKRPSASFVWQEAGIKQDVHRKEYIQTGDGSAAIVRFNNGKVLELGENSLILVDNIEDLSLSFLKGTGLVKADGKDAKITKDETGKARVEELSVQLLKPENLDTLLAQNEKLETVFSWRMQGETKKQAVIEISSVAEFKGKTNKIQSNTPSETKVALKNGKYYWRVVIDGTPVSGVKQFNIIQLAKLNPVSPKNTSLSVLSSKTQIKFKWNNFGSVQDNLNGTYQLELSENEGFKNPKTINIDPRTGFTNLSELEKGHYYWRIKTSYAGHHVVGDVAKVEIKTIDQLELALENIKEGAIIAFDQQKPLQFSWKSSISSEEVKYELKLKQESGSRFEKTMSTHETSSFVPGLTPGYFEAKVVALVGDKKIGESKPVKFSLLTDAAIKIKSPVENQKFEYWDDLPEIKLSWEKDPLVDQGYKYILDVADYQTFEKIVFTENLSGKTEKNYTPKSRANKQYWRLKLINPEGQTVKVSAIQSYELTHFPPPAAPTKLALESGGDVFKVENDSDQPTLIWDKLDQAKKYTLQVYKVENERSSKLVLERELTETKLKLSGLGEGDYRFSVRGIDQLGRKGTPSEFRKFSVSFGGILEAPESLTEEVQ